MYQLCNDILLDIMPPKEPVKVDPKRSVASHKRWVTNAVGRAEKFLGGNPNGFTNPRDIKDAEKLVAEIEEKLSGLEKKWTDILSPQLQDDDPDGLFDTLDADVLDTSEQANTWISGLKNAVEDYEATAAPAAAAAAAPAAPKKELKLNTAFKPSILARSSNLEEFHAWENSFRGHYEVNTPFLNAATP